MNFKLLKNIFPFIFCITILSATAQQKTNPKDQDEELGKVAWLRDYDAAIQLSAKHNKPILILFQEVPGCATCRNYGHNVLSNPLMTEAIENEFIPLAIFNNKGGNDAKILKKYNEPSWNNPVVRIVDQNGDNLVRRVASDYSAKGLFDAMVTSLKKYGNEIPEYMQILGKELSAVNNQKEAYYSMYCFWTGEKQLGSNEGVLNTEAGFMKGREVVKVTYNPEIIADQMLTSFAKQNNMSPINKDSSYRASKKDEDYYLQHSNFKYLPLSPLQRTKINSALGSRQNAEKYLSPKQLKWLTSLRTSEKKVRFDKEFNEAWASVE
ncbi:VPGUxxT family thioredoxin-like (seleno)protein, type 2 [Jejudonia soesokkakensis]|uniref:VPGUxxT family thioredoxin-like (Seleno)protein, type 2 n=1 Tax=Jejudonia soesokkakensis TaxID=1323432 RepID=A0ABW2MUL8_9FLAO